MAESGQDCNVRGWTYPPCVWRVEEILLAATDGLRREDERLAIEQAARGIDAIDEIYLHPIVKNGLTADGLGAWPEVPYPSAAALPKSDRDRLRCDLVLTEDPELPPADPVVDRREEERAEGTLFAGSLAEPPPATPLADVFWLEIKVTGQYTYANGVPGANRTYASELTRGPIQDARKLAKDPLIEDGGVLVVLFAEDEQTARHDLGVLTTRCIAQDLPLTTPVVECFPIRDKIGNVCCCVALYRLRAAR